MSYVKQNLESDEKIEVRARVNWLAIIPALLPLILAIIVSIVIESLIGDLKGKPEWIFWIYIGLCLIMIPKPIAVVITLLTTELMVTNKRVMYKVGVVARNVQDSPLIKIDNISFRQTFWGRLLNFGIVQIATTSMKVDISYILDANNFKNLAMKQVEYQKNLENERIAQKQAEEMAKAIALSKKI